MVNLMDLQSSQLNDDQKGYLIKSINDRLQKTGEFAKTVEMEARRSSGNKRSSRWITGLGGGLVAFAGIALTAVQDDNVKKYIGILSAVVGSAVATSGQFIDPAKSRQRAIGLKTVMIQLDSLAENSHVKSLGLQKDQADATELVTLNKDFMDEFVKIQKEAFDLGVDV
jgi:hypothetical protein